jgi:hypothetical protein
VTLYRVFPFDAGAAPTDRGGALFVPAPSGAGRIDNPKVYAVLYTASTATAAIAETFGRLPVWRADTFVHGSGLPYALATYELPAGVQLFDVNDIDALRAIGVTRPTDIITHARSTTQAWARKIFELGGHAGIIWWSYYNPAWPIVGLWEHSGLQVAARPEILGPASRAVTEAATAIVRHVDR